jgi:hypothetical protein
VSHFSKKFEGFCWTQYEKKIVDTKMSVFVCVSPLAINVIIRYRRDSRVTVQSTKWRYIAALPISQIKYFNRVLLEHVILALNSLTLSLT